MGALKKIYILHGWTYDLEKWGKFVNLLRVKGFDPVLLKTPGLTEENSDVWDLEKYSSWLNKQIGRQKAVILGHSNGGRIAAYFASRHPAKVEKLILMDSAGIRNRGLTLQLKRFLFGVTAKLGKKFTSSEVLKKFLYRLAGEKDYREASPNMRKTMLNLIKSDLTQDFGKIKVPTRIIWGENDKITPLSDGVLTNKLIRGSKLKVIGGARHSPFYTHPGQVVKIIADDI